MLFCFCTDEKDVEKIVYEVDQVLGGGELSLPVYPGVGNRPLKKKKLQILVMAKPFIDKSQQGLNRHQNSPLNFPFYSAR